MIDLNLAPTEQQYVPVRGIANGDFDDELEWAVRDYIPALALIG